MEPKPPGEKYPQVAQQSGTRLPVQETWVRFPGWEDPLEEGLATHSSILPGESHGQRSLVGYSPGGYRELDTTEQLNNNNKNKWIQFIYIMYTYIRYHVYLY